MLQPFSVTTEEIEIKPEGQETPLKVTVVKTAGELNIEDCNTFHETFDSILEPETPDESQTEEPKKIIVDLTECPHVVSRGFAQILVALAKTTTRGGDICVVGLQPGVKGAFRQIGMDDVVRDFQDIEDARKNWNAFKQPR